MPIRTYQKTHSDTTLSGHFSLGGDAKRMQRGGRPKAPTQSQAPVMNPLANRASGRTVEGGAIKFVRLLGVMLRDASVRGTLYSAKRRDVSDGVETVHGMPSLGSIGPGADVIAVTL